SQHQEDLYFVDFLGHYQLDPQNDIYVDVGANHPMSISNTYLLYRKGFKGVLIEPNLELAGLSKQFRAKDIVMPIGCSDENGMIEFQVSKTPVLSSFSGDRQLDVYESYYCPVLTLDNALKALQFRHIFLLSIDVEGLGYEVLLGAENILKSTLLVCIEYDDKKEVINQQMEKWGFELIKDIAACNTVYLNQQLHQKLHKNSRLSTATL
ncbi:MAG: FkbM family methyltransferase, partial [Bacteroidota bacterium]